MRYKLHYEPFYDFESISILKNIVNGKSIKDDMDDLIERRGSRYKSAATKLFNKPIALEKYIAKNVKLSPPGYEANGQQMAEFLFKERSDNEFCFANAIFCYNRNLQHGTDNKEVAILETIDDDFDEKNGTINTSLVIGNTTDFFMLVEEYDISDEDKLGAIRLYHSFDMYLSYMTLLLSQVKKLINDKLPDFQLTSVMRPIYTQFENNSDAFLFDKLNIKLDDTHIYSIYPGIYKPNTLSSWGTEYTDISVIFGMHLLDIIDTLDQMESNDEKTELFLRALSDNTKLSILKLLKDGPMYGSQLAEKLNCTGANISHHTSTLLTLNLVHYEKENNRVYLHLNKDDICRYLDDAKELFL